MLTKMFMNQNASIKTPISNVHAYQGNQQKRVLVIQRGTSRGWGKCG